MRGKIENLFVRRLKTFIYSHIIGCPQFPTRDTAKTVDNLSAWVYTLNIARVINKHMIITKEQFKQYAIDVKGYNEDMVREIFQQMRDFGTSIQEYLTQEELEECVAYNA